jgi:FkbM family methyltransferase
MNTVELSARWLKYQLGFRDTSGFVVWLRPYFNKAMDLLYGKRGLLRAIGGQEPLRLRPAYRNFKDDYECEVFRYLAEAIKLDDVVLEVGAHVGITTVFLARCLGQRGRIFAFEPSPRSLQALTDHLSLNGICNGTVSIIPVAVSDKCGRALFYFDGTSGENTLSLKHSRVPAAESLEVETVTIDEFCSRNQITPTFIKIDIEGYELHALRGAERTLRHCRPTVIVEIHPMNWPEIGVRGAEMAEFISLLNYQMVPLEQREDPLAGYGHVVIKPAEQS